MWEHIRTHLYSRGATDNSKHVVEWRAWLASGPPEEYLGEFLEHVLTDRARGEWAAAYLYFRYQQDGRRENELSSVRTALRAYFRTGHAGTFACWDSDAVVCMRKSAPRSVQETRDKVMLLRLTSKFEVNFYIMNKIRDFLTPGDDDWSRWGMTRKMVWLSCVWMFDIGMRVGNCTTTGKGRNPSTTVVAEAREGARVDQPHLDGLSLEEERREEERLEAEITSHTWRHQDFKYIYLDRQGEICSMWGGEEWYRLLLTLPNHRVEGFDVYFVTGKTSRGANIFLGPKLTKPARVDRTGLLPEILDLHLDVIRNNGMMKGYDEVFRMNKPMSTRGDGQDRFRDKSIQSGQVSEVLKIVGRTLGIAESHLSPISLRKGSTSTAFFLRGEERRMRMVDMTEIAERGGPVRGWVPGSQVPEKHYLSLYHAKGPFSMAASWEAVSEGGVRELLIRQALPPGDPGREGIPTGLPKPEKLTVWRRPSIG
jgi:hypothetical protein